MQKKLLALLLSVSLIASLFACIPMSAFAAEPGNNVTPEGKGTLANGIEGSVTWYAQTNGANDAAVALEVLPTEDSIMLNENIAGLSTGYTLQADGSYASSGSTTLAGYLYNCDNDNDSDDNGDGTPDYDKTKVMYSAQTAVQNIQTYEDDAETILINEDKTTMLRDNRNSSFEFKNATGTIGYDSQGAYTYGENTEKTRTADGKPLMYEDVYYDLGEGATVTDINFGGQYSTNVLRPSNYQVFMSNDLAALYSDDNLVYHYINDENAVETVIQHYHFAEAVEARYVGFRILCPTTGKPSDNWAVVTNYTRVSLCQIWGSPASVVFTENDGDFTNTEKMFANVDTSKALVNALTAFTAQEMLDLDGDGVFTSSGKIGTLGPILYDNTIQDADWNVSNDVLINKPEGGAVEYYKDGTKGYFEMVYDFAGQVAVDDILFISHKNDDRTFGSYTLYMGDDLETIFEEPIYTRTVDNHEKKFSLNQFKFNEPVECRYVVMRVLDPEAQENPQHRGVRFHEFNVYGERISWAPSLTSDDTEGYEGIDTSRSLYNNNKKNAELLIYQNDENGNRVGDTSYELGATAKVWGTDILKSDELTNQNIGGGSGHVDINSIDPYNAASYDLIFNLGVPCNVDTVALISGTGDSNRWIREFDIFAVNELSELADAEPLAGYHPADGVVSNRRHVYIDNEGFEAQYVIFRIYKVDTFMNSANGSYARIEANVYGEVADGIGVNKGVYQPADMDGDGEATGEYDNLNSYKQYVDLSKNLLGDKATVYQKVFYEGDTYDTVLTDKIDSDLTSTTDIGVDLTWRSFVGDTEIFWKDEAGNIRNDESKYYQEIAYDFDGTAKISAIRLFGHYNPAYAPLHYKVSVADSLDELFTEDATTIDVDNIWASRSWIVFGEPVEAKVVGLRIIGGVAPSCELQYDWCYSRICHFSVEGEMTHTCVYDKEVANEAFVATEANCKNKATYYKSCECGHYNVKNETFEDAAGALDPTNHVGNEVEVTPAITATCKTEGFTAATEWDCCDAAGQTATSLGLDPNNHEGEEIEKTPAVTATCKTEGFTASTEWNCCNAVGQPRTSLGFDASNHEGNEVEVTPAITATCKTEGFTASTKYDCCDAPAKAAESLGYNKANHEGTVVSDGKGVKATFTKDGKTDGTKYSCCGVAVAAGKTVYKASSVKLSTSSYTYDGKAKKPSVVLKDSKGNKLTSADYSVSYASGRKAVGRYKVTIKLKGRYSGTKYLYFTIVPKNIKLKSVKAGSKSLTVKWTKTSSHVKGYEIQYSTSSKFTKKTTKTIKVTSYKSSSKTIKKLKAKKKYYVRIRAYKTVSGKTYYSKSWSSKKYATTKK